MKRLRVQQSVSRRFPSSTSTSFAMLPAGPRSPRSVSCFCRVGQDATSADQTDASEILPTMLRSKGIAIYSTVQSITVTYNQCVATWGIHMGSVRRLTTNADMLTLLLSMPSVCTALDQCPQRRSQVTDRTAWRYYFLFIALQIFFFVYAWFGFKETKGYTMEEVSYVYDGPDAVDEIRRNARLRTEQGDSKLGLDITHTEEAETVTVTETDPRGATIQKA